MTHCKGRCTIDAGRLCALVGCAADVAEQEDWAASHLRPIEEGAFRDYTVPLTSRAACRIYLGQVDALVSEVIAEKISPEEAQEAYKYAIANLQGYLHAAFSRRLANLTTTTAEAPAGTEPP